jgi:histidyl-tRNA synthetase
MTTSNKLNTESYKGVRDFYPEDMAIQKHIFNTMQKTAERFGYIEYSASVLEPAELYRAKSGEEIINEQTYTFTDRGDREVTLRPEMTPTVARMVAARKRELPFPLRWYSIPNLFRYEKPQRGRLREHWQLNVDIFGIESHNAEVEIILIASATIRAFGLENSDFTIRINSRKVVNYVLREIFFFDEQTAYKLSKLIDKKNKMKEEEFNQMISEITGSKGAEFLTILNSKNLDEYISHLPAHARGHQSIQEIQEVIQKLDFLGVTNVSFDQTLMRGFDYYTGIVFEAFDNHPDNRRALLGGGRYDDLLSIFGGEKVPTVGFGMGDVTVRDMLETYNLLPAYQSSAVLAICPTDESAVPFSNEIAQRLREENINVAVDYSDKKIGDKMKIVDKQKIPFAICVGKNEISSGKYLLKHMITRKEKEVTEADIIRAIKGDE